jgi:mannose-6-phosphate isomerase
VQDDYRTHYTPLKNESQLLVDCPYFSTAVYDLTESMSIDYTELDSFVILIGLKGEATLTIDGEDVNFKGGECLLIPATVQEVSTCGTIKFLETYVLS